MSNNSTFLARVSGFGLFIMLLCGSYLKAQNVNIPDLNFKNALLADTALNINMDNEIQVSEAQSFYGGINVSYQNIQDMTGIEAFVNIIQLICNNNQISTLDLSGNPQLIDLYCQNNQLTGITGLGSSLVKLVCSNNQLSGLDISNAMNLEELYCRDNNITTLNVANHSQLKILSCSNNSITTLALGQNYVLQTLYCSNNQINMLNVSNCISLKYLSCFSNELTSLDVSMISTLVDLACYDNLLTNLDLNNTGTSGLKFLSCYNNQLTTLNAGDLGQLDSLYCWNNLLNDLILTNDSSLVFINCSGNNLTMLDNTTCTSLEVVYCYNNQLAQAVFIDNPNLRLLSCFNNQIETLELQSLSLLDSLDCSYNNLSSLNIKNGNNANLGYYSSVNNQNLYCITVDDPAYMDNNWAANKDTWGTFYSDCDALGTISTEIDTSDYSICMGSTIPVRYYLSNGNLEFQKSAQNVQGSIASGNYFTAQLSDENGDFSSPIDIGMINSGSSGIIYATIPTNIPDGNGYLIRVVSSTPYIEGSPTPYPITIHNSNFNLDFSVSSLMLNSSPMDVVFTNNTPNMNLYTFTWFPGDGAQFNNNDFNVNYTYQYNDTFYVTLLAVNNVTGCASSITTDYLVCNSPDGIVCNHPAAIDGSMFREACAGGSVTLTTPFVSQYYYQWMKDGVAMNGENNSELVVTESGSYTVNVINANGCPRISDPVFVSFNLTPIAPPVISTTDTIINCAPVNVTLRASGGFDSYQWTNGTLADSLVVNQAGTYFVKGITADGCEIMSAPFDVSNSMLTKPTICMVTVDTTTNQHILVWEKPIATDIAYYAIYKEIPFNSSNYVQIDTVDYNSLSEYIDVNSDASVVTDRYRISMIDTCGGETALSDYVRAIGLKVLPGIGNERIISWNPYVEISQNITSYLVYSGPDYNNMSYLTTVNAISRPYIDTNPVAGVNTVYRIQAVLSSPCESTRAVRNRSVSNGTGNINLAYPLNFVPRLQSKQYEFKVLPNPNTGSFVINWKNNEIAPNAQYWIESVMGARVTAPVSIHENNTIVNTQITPGTYFLKIQSDSGEWVMRMIVIK
ncbi:MAG: T9SS type A sorting domain-containing protein [Bacteroidia bacterium]|nr:T9SS type A sorting domain-containing protein [Bacteroidia bacterium]